MRHAEGTFVRKPDTDARAGSTADVGDRRSLAVDVVGVAAWTPCHGHWGALVDAAHGWEIDGATRAPSASILPPAERRRAPNGVSVALEVARIATHDAASRGVDVASLPSVFASAHGDLAIVDYLALTLATAPLDVSPTRFHLSVHNAASGYWSIATGNRAASTALAGGEESFALGLLEASTQAVALDRSVLLVAFDTPATGLLAHAVHNVALCGFALVVAPRGARDVIARLELVVEDGLVTAPLPHAAPLRAFAATSPAARALALVEALADTGRRTVTYPLGAATSLAIRVDVPHAAPPAIV